MLRPNSVENHNRIIRIGQGNVDGPPREKDDEASIARQIVADIQNGHAQAETQLVLRYSRGLTFLLRRLTSNGDIAEDLKQDVLQLVLTKVRNGEIRDSSKLAAYIQQIARNTTIEHFRRIKRRSENLEKNQYVDENNIPDPDESSLRDEKANLVRQLISELPNERDRQILYRFHVAEQDKEQVCDDLGLDTIHFNRVIFRARQRFKELWEKNQQ